MRVLLTTPYDLAVPGGVNRHARDLLATLCERGIEARLVGPASAPLDSPDPRITVLGRIWVGDFNGARSRVTLDTGIFWKLRRLMRAFLPDVVHVQEPYAPALNTFALLLAGRARRVGTFHTFGERGRGYLWTWPWCRWMNSLLDVRVAVSASARDYATRYHPAAFHVVPNGVRLPDPDQMRPPRPPGNPSRVLFVGRADEPRKGFAVLQEAMRRLDARARGRFALEAIGPATLRGAVSDAALSAAWPLADVCVVPSLSNESFGLVALEALAHGIPVVASGIRGYSDWLAGTGVGELVPPGDADALAQAVYSLTVYPERYLTCVARTRPLAERYGWNAIATQLIELYRG